MNNRNIRIITDSFTQCELCQRWERLDKADETGWRTIPLFNIKNDRGREIWVCEVCWDKKQEEEEEDEE